jgi:hypothetical protein
MTRHGHLLCTALLASAACIALACGNVPHRILQSISLSPSTADAQNFPNGQVQFTATGTYNTAPISVTPLTANWSAVLNGEASNAAVSVDSNGLAQCNAGASGVYSIGAWDVTHPTVKTTCTVIGPYGDPCNSTLGTAQLTCP